MNLKLYATVLGVLALLAGMTVLGIVAFIRVIGG